MLAAGQELGNTQVINLNAIEGVSDVTLTETGDYLVTLSNGREVVLRVGTVSVSDDGLLVSQATADKIVAIAAEADDTGFPTALVGLAIGGGALAAVGVGASGGGGGSSASGGSVDGGGVENTAAVISGVTAGAVTEDAAASLTTSGTLTVTDVDAGEAVFAAQTGTAGDNGFGSFTLSESGAWTYTADNSQTSIQSLGAGDTATDSFTAVTADGTTQVVTVTLTGVNDTAVISGVTTGAVTEDAAASLTTSGTLTVTDVDAGEAVFAAQTGTAGDNGFGSFTLSESGAWTYTADNSQTSIQSLGAGDTATDSFTAVTADGTTQVVTVTLTGVNDTAVISGVTTGAVTEDAAASLTTSGTLTVTDVDAGEAVFAAQTGTAGDNGFGSFTLSESGAWTYTADNSQTSIQSLGAGDTATDSFTAVTADGTTQVVTVTLTGVNDTAVISGVTTGAVTEDAAASLTTSGTLTVTDVDAGEAVFAAQTGTAGDNGFGSFTLSESGAWTYTADNSQTSIQSLGAGDTATDSFTAVTADGTTQVVTVTLTGVNDTAVISGVTTGAVTEDAAASLTTSGTLTVTDVDAGEAVFAAQTGTAGDNGFGSFTLSESGAWTYTADNSQTSIQSLGAGDTATDSFTAVTADGTTQVVTVTLTGVNDTAVISGVTTGAVTEDAAASLTTSGTLTVTDVDAGEAVFAAQTGTAGDNGFGSFTLSESGAWTYTADNSQTSIQSLGAGDTATDSFTAVTADGTTQVVTVTLTGVNDTAVISGVTTGAVTEDAAASLTTSGTLTVTDVDAGEAVFAAQTGTAGDNGFGSFTLSESGAWTYTADNSQTSIQSLGAGDTATDSFTAVTADGTTQVVTVTLTGVNDTAVISGVTTGAVTEDAAASLTTSGTLTVTDVDAGEAVFAAQTGTAGDNGFGSFTLSESGAWTYTADNSQTSIQSLGAGDTATDSFTAVTADGTTQVVTVTLTGVNDTAVISGVTTGAVTEDAAASLTTSGTLTVTDVDAGEAVFAAQTGTAGDNGFGSFTLSESGAWTYTADNSQTSIQSLGAGDTATDSFTAVTADGTTQVVTVTLTGVNDTAVIGGVTTGAVTEDAVAVTEDAAASLTTSGTLTVTDVDAGEAVFAAQTGTAGDNGFGSFTLSESGAWTYTADNSQTAIQNLGAGDTATDSFTAVTADGTTQVVTVTLTGVNDTAVIGGVTTGAVTEDAVAVTEDAAASLTTSGTLTVTDVDAGEAVFAAQTGTAGDNGFGSFTLSESGAWTYTADNSQTAIQNLGAGDTATDSFTAVTADGTTQVVTVTLTGRDVDLSTVEDGIGGFVINGVSAYDQSGYSVSSAGDVNGDGFDDLIIGARYDDPNGDDSGASFVVFGKTDGSAVELSDVENGTGGFVINGISASDQSGRSVSSAGDVNGDGFADLIVGALYDSPNGDDSGASFVVFGKTDGSAVELSDIESDANTDGFVINGVSGGDESGRSVSSAGDVNGDGFDDLIIGAPGDDPNSFSSGASFVVFGKTDGSAVELSDVDEGTNPGGFVINGVTEFDDSGNSVSSAGDVNGDGFDDLIIGAREDDPNGTNSGASFVVFGKTDGSVVDLSDIEGDTNTDGFVINGISEFDSSGRSVSSAGDVNGDGFDDLIIGANGDDPNGGSSGASFVVFGKTDGSAVDLSDIESNTNSGGFVINGVSAYDSSGYSVSSAGDVNGDGFDDLIIGANGDDPNGNSSGASFVVFGKTDGSAVELSDVEDGTGGFVINGISAVDSSGRSVSSAGDVNGDGFDDLIIGASNDDPNGGNSGASFVVFGGDFEDVLTEVGTTEADALTGTVDADQLIGGTGNDTLTGAGGADVLRGGAGDDVLAVSDLGFARIAGGTGTDTLQLDGSGQVLDLLALDNTSLDGIEQIDLGSDDNTLVLSQIEVLRLSDSSNTLRVLGDASDGVTLSDGGWLPAGTVTDAGGTFDVFTNGNATLEVAQGIAVDGLPIAAVDLSDIESDDNAGGFVINGVAAYDTSGYSVSSAGDVNGDGFDDVIVGANGDDPNGGSSGASFVVFGKTDGSAVELSDVENGTGGFVINGAASNDNSGYSVSSAGDVNGDGFDDLIVGTRYDDPNSFYSSYDPGASFVVFGKTDGSAVELSDIESDDNTDGFVINGVAEGDESGRSVSSAGDVNGDGFDDLIIGARYDDPNGGSSGASFVVFGKADGSAVELSDIESNTNPGGFVINGVSAGDESGYSVSSAGDVNGDGFDDLIIGARLDDPNGNNNSGASFVVFGKTDGSAVDLSDIESNANTDGFVINGASTLDESGFSVSSAGDVNGDGFDDLIIGAPYDDPNGGFSGASFVVFGKTDGSAVELSDIEGDTNSGGFVINGVSGFDQSGREVSSAGDVNGDGFDDVIVGVFGDDPNGSSSGASFVVFGKTDGSVVELSDVEDGTGGFVINGVSASDQSGRSVSGAGDVNGDGFDDLIVGAPYDDPNGVYSGASFVVFGGDFQNLLTEVGTTGADTLTGTVDADQLIGGTGDDTLTGEGGADVLRGGAGDDVLAVSDLGFARIAGGTGTDTLQLDGSGQVLRFACAGQHLAGRD